MGEPREHPRTRATHARTRATHARTPATHARTPATRARTPAKTREHPRHLRDCPKILKRRPCPQTRRSHRKCNISDHVRCKCPLYPTKLHVQTIFGPDITISRQSRNLGTKTPGMLTSEQQSDPKSISSTPILFSQTLNFSPDHRCIHSSFFLPQPLHPVLVANFLRRSSCFPFLPSLCVCKLCVICGLF